MLAMAVSHRKRWIALICLALNGLILTILCVGWQVQRITFPHEVVLLGCAAASTILCLLRLIMSFLYGHQSPLPGSWRSESILSAIEVCTLALLIGVLYTSETAKECLRGKEAVAARVCRMVVCEPLRNAQGLSYGTDAISDTCHRQCRSCLVSGHGPRV